MYKSLLIALFTVVTACFSSVQAQGIIRGVIADGTTGETLIGANVIIRDPYKGAMAVSLLAMVAAAALEPVLPALLKPLVDIFFAFGIECGFAISLFKRNNRNKDLVLYNCTSGYPVPFKDVCLLDINLLTEKYGKEVKHIGFSGHHLGIAVDVAAYTLGANIIERHYTIDRTWKGTDHAASLEPMGLRKLTRDVNAVYDALQFKEQDILPIEQVQRDKLKNQKV